MNKITIAFLFLTLVVGACSFGNTLPESAPTQNAASTMTGETVTATAKPKATETAVPEREAVLSEVENDVLARALSSVALIPASDGMSIHETGGVETSDASRVRVDLLPDASIVRVGPNSSFTVLAVTEEEGEPVTTFELLFGQIYILLNGGSLDVQTASGTASVRGSLMGVTYSPGQKRATVTCLDGHCAIRDADEELEITAGQAADFINGELEDAPRFMYFEELGLWMLSNPDLRNYLLELPNLPDLPDGFDWNYDFNSDPNFDFFFDPGFNPGDRIINPEFGLPRQEGVFPGEVGPPRLPGDRDPPGPRR